MLTPLPSPYYPAAKRSGPVNFTCPVPTRPTATLSYCCRQISIATLPLDTLEHIIDDFKAHGAKHGLAGRSGGGPTVRINTNSTATASGSGGGGCAARSSTRSWNPVAGSAAALAGAPSRRSHGNLGSLSFSFEGKPVTPAAGASGSGSGPGSLPGALVQQPVLPGLPPGAPITLSNRAAAVLQVWDWFLRQVLARRWRI